MVQTTWAELVVGDICRVDNRDVIPADMVILAVKEKTEVVEGRCYVETKSLDGETNLKMRRALKCTKASITGPGDLGAVGRGGRDGSTCERSERHPNLATLARAKRAQNS
jgi:P-type E1-E2 ATPase